MHTCVHLAIFLEIAINVVHTRSGDHDKALSGAEERRREGVVLSSNRAKAPRKFVLFRLLVGVLGGASGGNLERPSSSVLPMSINSVLDSKT